MLSVGELYRYSSIVRRRFADKLAQLSWDEVNENREASYYSMKNILVHMIDNEDWIVNWVIPDKATEYKRKRRSSEYLDMKMVTDHLQDVESKTMKYLGNAREEDLQMKTKLVITSGDTFQLSVEECLIQTFTEQLYHIGELIALLWQKDIEPPKMQWFWNNPRDQE